MDERALVKKLNRGSRSALDQAIQRYTPYVSAVILRALAGRACREDVEELCADVFVALWSHAHQLDPEQGLRPWLAAVARNKAADWLRRCRPADPIPDNAPDPSPGPEELAQRREQSARLWAAVGTKGSNPTNSSGPFAGKRRPSTPALRARRKDMPRERVNSSSNTSRRRATARAS